MCRFVHLALLLTVACHHTEPGDGWRRTPLPASDVALRGLAYDPFGDRLLVLDAAGVMTIVDRATGRQEELQLVVPDGGERAEIVVGRAGEVLVVGLDSVDEVDLATGRLEQRIDLRGEWAACARIGGAAIWGREDPGILELAVQRVDCETNVPVAASIRGFDLETGARFGDPPLEEPLYLGALATASPNGDHMAAAGPRLLVVQTYGPPIEPRRAHVPVEPLGDVEGLAATPDGTTLFVLDAARREIVEIALETWPAPAGSVYDAFPDSPPDPPPVPLDICDPAYGPFAVEDVTDVSYTQWESTGCLDSEAENACACQAGRPFIEGFLGCEAVIGGYWWGLGSEAVRVMGRSGGDCLFDVGSEMEGGVAMFRCTLPLPIVPWPGLLAGEDRFLDGIEDRCELLGQCSVFEDSSEPCAESGMNVPGCSVGHSCR